MNDFNQREQAFENKFGHDSELEFKIAGRAAHAFGLWAAGQLGLKDPEAEAYAKQAVSIETSKTSGRAELITKTEKDLAAKNLIFSHHRLEKEMNVYLAEARKQIAG